VRMNARVHRMTAVRLWHCKRVYDANCPYSAVLCSAIDTMLAVVGPRLLRLRLHAVPHITSSHYSLVPTVLTHCPLLLQLEVVNMGQHQVLTPQHVSWHKHAVATS
jgi:hypothetical protein